MYYPEIDPVAFKIGPLDVRWYGLAYFFGVILGVWMARRIAGRVHAFNALQHNIEDFGAWAILGIIFGGRIGSVIFYNFWAYVNNPVEIFKVWKGGMSFHGGLIGVVIVAFFVLPETKY